MALERRLSGTRRKKRKTQEGVAVGENGDVRERLERIARNLWWSWSTEARALWDRVAAEAPEKRREELKRNPLLLVRWLSVRALRDLASDDVFMRDLAEVEERFDLATAPIPAPFGLDENEPVAYFSMEYGLHESLPIYAGGLGLLAGDHVKSASDLGVPLVAVGLFYRQGYFRQEIDGSGHQRVVYPTVDYGKLPIEEVRHPESGEPLRIEVELAGRTVTFRVWRILAGRVSVLLLDSDIAENAARDRRLTHRLYGGTREDRIQQEVIAGIGGLELLRVLGMRPGAWHLNEGHVAFLTLGRIRELRDEGFSFEEAVEIVAADTIFTTHTPVPEGNEVFDLALADRYLRPYAEKARIALEDYLRLGLDRDPEGRRVLSLTVLAIRLSRFRNGVSRLHGQVSRAMWSKLWPGFRAEEVPIGSVTNGVHMPTWVAPQFDALYREHLADDWADRLADPEFWKSAEKIPDRKVWIIKQGLKRRLVDFVRRRVAERLEREGASEQAIRRATESLLDPEAFTIGFARRFALYKRAALLFRDMKKAVEIFGSTKRPVQIIFAGKPHPEDPEGKRLFEKVQAISERRELRGRVVLLENYDIEVARHMVQGVDLWLNNPRRPLEASGTSGQKVPINGGLNLSILDGWWCEGFSDDTGFAFGRTKDYSDPEKQDRDDHLALLRVLTKQVIPLYYRRNGRGIPADWIDLVRRSIARLVPAFSTHTMVSNYARELYVPAAENGRLVRASGGVLARELAEWRQIVERSWPLVHLRGVTVVAPEKKPKGARAASLRKKSREKPKLEVDVEAYFAGIDPHDILCSDSSGVLVPIASVSRLANGAVKLRIPVAERGTFRLFPAHSDLVTPHELGVSLPFEV